MPRTKESAEVKKFKRWWNVYLNTLLREVCRVSLTEDEAYNVFEMAFLAPLRYGVERFKESCPGGMPEDEELKNNLNKALLLDFPLAGKAGLQLRAHSPNKPAWANLCPWTPRYIVLPGHLLKKFALREVAGVDYDLVVKNTKASRTVRNKVFRGTLKGK